MCFKQNSFLLHLEHNLKFKSIFFKLSLNQKQPFHTLNKYYYKLDFLHKSRKILKSRRKFFLNCLIFIYWLF